MITLKVKSRRRLGGMYSGMPGQKNTDSAEEKEAFAWTRTPASLRYTIHLWTTFPIKSGHAISGVF